MGSVVVAHVVALQCVGSSQASDQISVPCIARQILNQWTTREALFFFLNIYLFLFGRTESLLQHVESSVEACGIFPDQGLNPSPQLWEHRVLTSGPSGRSLKSISSVATKDLHVLQGT